MRIAFTSEQHRDLAEKLGLEADERTGETLGEKLSELEAQTENLRLAAAEERAYEELSAYMGTVPNKPTTAAPASLEDRAYEELATRTGLR